MNQNLGKLLQILPPPPPNGTAGGSPDWDALQQSIGYQLPKDYQEFCQLFPPGVIGVEGEDLEIINVYHPRSENPYLNLTRKVPEDLRMFSSLRNDDREQHPYPLAFEPGGLLPWGNSVNGDYYFWRTNENLDPWTVVVYPDGGALKRRSSIVGSSHSG